MTAAATNLTPKSGISHSGKNGCITYLANVSPIIELVVGLQWKIRMVFVSNKYFLTTDELFDPKINHNV